MVRGTNAHNILIIEVVVMINYTYSERSYFSLSYDTRVIII